MDKTSNKYGKIVITLNDYLTTNNISKTKIALGANIQRTQLLKYCRNDIARVDLGVMARMCSFLGCKIEDLLRYEPADNE